MFHTPHLTLTRRKVLSIQLKSFKKINKSLAFCCIYLLFSPVSLWAANQSIASWTFLSLTGSYKDFLYTLSPELRATIWGEPPPFNVQTLPEMGMGYQIAPEWQVWLGQTWLFTDKSFKPLTEEYRIWEQIVWNPAQFKIFQLRTRLEERESLESPGWDYRLRNRFLFSISIKAPYLFVLSDEPFIDVNGGPAWTGTGVWNQNRAYIGIAQQVDPSTLIGVGYMNQYVFTTPAQCNNIIATTIQINF